MSFSAGHRRFYATPRRPRPESEPQDADEEVDRRFVLSDDEGYELVMRRYERASTILTSNRPVDDWGRTSCAA